MADFTMRPSPSSVAATLEALDSIVAAAQRGAPVAVVRASSAFQAQARRDASGRPGPKVRTGALRRSILVMGGRGPMAGPPMTAVRVAPYRWASIVAPTVVYGRIQELGGTVRPVNPASHAAAIASGRPWMLGWGGTAGRRTSFARQVTLPPRPYLAPAAVAGRPAAWAAFYAAMAASINQGSR